MAEQWNAQIQFVNARDQHAQIVGDHLGQNFVHLTLGGLAPHRISEFRFDHMECGLHVAPLVIAGQERVPLVGEEVAIRSHTSVMAGSCGAGPWRTGVSPRKGM